MTHLIQTGRFLLNSGRISGFKLQCDALTEDDWKGAAYLIRRLIGHFSSVEGIPTGGNKLSFYLWKLASQGGPHLIVDDVLTTGGSMEKARARYLRNRAKGQTSEIVGAVLFARGPLPTWIKAVFPMPSQLWLDNEELD
jgi:orotate phosphoribosyltransferase